MFQLYLLTTDLLIAEKSGPWYKISAFCYTVSDNVLQQYLLTQIQSRRLFTTRTVPTCLSRPSFLPFTTSTTGVLTRILL